MELLMGLMVVVVEAVLLSGAVWWMRDGGGGRWQLICKSGGGRLPGKSIFVARGKQRKEHQSLLPQLLAARACNFETPK